MRDRKNYAVRRWGKAIDRLLGSESMVEKEAAIKWAAAWSTAYLGRVDRRGNGGARSHLKGLERRRRNRY